MTRKREIVRRSDDAALAASEERFRAAFDALDDSLMLFSPVTDDDGCFADARIDWINRTARDRWFDGAPLQDLRGGRLFELFPGVKAAVFDIFSDVAANGTDFRGVISLRHDELGERILELHVTPFEGGYIHSSRDITAAREAQTALQEREKELAASEVRLIRLTDSLTARVDELDALRRVSQLLAESRDPRAVLDRVAMEIRGLLGARCTRIHVLNDPADASGAAMTTSGSAGCPDFLDPELDLIHATLEGGSPVMTSPAGHVSDHHVSIPMLSGSRLVGVLIAGRQDRAFTGNEISIATTTADMLAAALQNAAIHEMARRQAASDERQHLARELHDAVSQSIFSASLIAEALPAVWKRSPAQAERDLFTLRRLVRTALAELRTLLYELRPAALQAASLETLLERLGDSLIGRNEIRLEVSVPPGLVLPLDVKTALYRVAREALSNVAKHAQATVARVTVSLDDDLVRLTVSDDGLGISAEGDANEAGSGESYGLGIMRERAEGIGAAFEVYSEHGDGTMVEMTWNRPAEGITPGQKGDLG